MEKKKIAAAIAAVYAHIKTHEEAAGLGANVQVVEPPVEEHPYNTWGITGRQTQMQANTMMQLRMFK